MPRPDEIEEQDDDLLLDGDDAEPDFEVPEDGPIEVPTETRADRRRNRFREQIEAREAAERERDELKRQLEQATRQPVYQPPPQAAPAGPDPIDKELDDIYERRKQLAENYYARSAKGEVSREEHDKYLRDARKLEGETMRLEVRRELARSGHQGQSPQDATRHAVKVRHFDVAANPQAWAYAEHEYLKQTKALGKPDSVDLLDEVMDDARKQFRIGRYKDGAAGPEPTARDRARLAGPPRGSASPQGKRTYQMSELERQMADIAFEHIEDPKERYRLYAQGLTSDSKK